MKKLLLSLLLCSICSIPAEALFRRIEEFNPNVSVYACKTPGEACDDTELVKRIINAYHLADKSVTKRSLWESINDTKHSEIKKVFDEKDIEKAKEILRNPGKTKLLFGMEITCSEFLKEQLTPQGLVNNANSALDALIRLGEAIGAFRLDNPEAHYMIAPRKWDSLQVTQDLQNALGFAFDFPNPYPDEVGIYTQVGVATPKCASALYNAYRIRELVKDIPNPRILEIGAGIGRTAYYCRQMGITDYTIVDIPLTCLVSAYHLGRTVGEDAIVLLGEKSDNLDKKIKIISPELYLLLDDHYDLIVNFDSMTEMSEKSIETYLNKIQKYSSIFFSVNHEVNKQTVFEEASKINYIKRTRHPYWMRIGYSEEVYYFR